MANEKNLISIGDRTTSEQREITRMGGIASGEARREKKRLRDCAEAILSLPVSDRRKFNKLARMGIEIEDIDNRMLMVAALIDEAQTGNVQAAKEVRSIIGEDVNLPPADDEDDGLIDAIKTAVKSLEV